MKFTKNDKEFILTSKPWWTSHAFELSDGGIGVARVSARSATLRYHKRDSNLPSDYTSGTVEEGYGGDYVRYMLDLTQEELNSIKENSDYVAMPDPDFVDSVDTKRPKTNNPKYWITSEREQRRVHELLQNEGNIEPEFVDKTPYQKGDDLP